ncbi:MAG: hypothetical protein M3539_07535 [Acidobacteriota bacterium]|nr:hypothetical protein [Acidobacteriota bacterium]
MSHTKDWQPTETTTHQDHVIAHVLDATVPGYFVFDEALYILLDIGFIWTIFLDGQMTLLPHPVAISELDIDQQGRDEIKADIDLLLGDDAPLEKLSRMKLPSLNFRSQINQIKDVKFFAQGDDRRLLLECEEANLAIETSVATAEFNVYEC